MKIEAFSEGKDLDDLEAVEDQLLVLPGKGYAVLDGATDVTGALYDGRRGGWLASRLAMRAVAGFLLDPAERDLRPERLIEHVNVALCDCYARHGILESLRGNAAKRFGTTLALAADLGETFRFVLIGDSGLRINATETFIDDTGLDLVTARLRVEAYRIVQETGGASDARARVGRACAFYGATAIHPDMQPWLDESKRLALYERALGWCRVRFPAVREMDIRHLLDTGILGQARFANNMLSPLSYAVLDGFDIPPPLVHVIDRPRAEIHSIELFTDGYFKPGASPSVSSWEAAFIEVERADPEKIGQYPSVKGSSERIRTDDRTVLIVNL